MDQDSHGAGPGPAPRTEVGPQADQGLGGGLREYDYSRPIDKKEGGCSSKKSTALKAAVAPSLPSSGEVEDEEEATETPEEPLTRKKRSRKEPAVAQEVTPFATPQDPGTTGTTLGGVPFGEAAHQVLSDAADIFGEQPPTPSPPTHMARDPLLSIEDFVVEQADPSPSGAAPSLDQAMPAGCSTQFSLESGHAAPIVIDDGMILPYEKFLFQC